LKIPKIRRRQILLLNNIVKLTDGSLKYAFFHLNMDVVFIWFTGDIIDFAGVFSTGCDRVEAIIKNNKAKLKRILIILYNEIIINIALTHAKLVSALWGNDDNAFR